MRFKADLTMKRTLLSIVILLLNTIPCPLIIAGAPEPAKSGPTIEKLITTIKPSVVTVTHAGRGDAKEGTGTGFVVGEGLIATSLHVIGEGRAITIRLADGKQYDVTEIHAWDRKQDLAVLRIDAKGLKPIPLGDSAELKQGSTLIAFGNPLGFAGSVVQGILSARRELELGEMLQLAIPVEPGNSGGPVIDIEGRVQGIMTLKSTVTQNLGFAMPVNAIKPLLAKPNPVPMDRWLTIGALNSNEWKTLLGARWTQRAGRIQVRESGTGFGGRAICLYQKETPKMPHEIQVDVKLNDEAGAAGLIFAADGADKHYGFYPTAGKLRLTRFDGPTVYQWTILTETNSPHYLPGDWNTLKVRHDKGRIQCFVNGHLAIESLDTGLTSGAAGLAKFRTTQAEFRQFQIGSSLQSKTIVLPPDLRKEIDALKGETDQLTAKLKSAPGTIPYLRDRAKALDQQAARLRRLSDQLHEQSVQDELLKALAGPDDKNDLLLAALLLAKLDNEEIDTNHYRDVLDDFARQMMTSIPKDSKPEQKIERLRKFLFEENGFHGSRGDYYNRANSYLNEVIEDREGIPITLSILYIELATRLGLNVVGIPLPGHFIVEHRSKEGKPQLIDVYDDGKPISRAEASLIVKNQTGVALEEYHLKPTSKREMIIRMLRNIIRNTPETQSTPLLRSLNTLLVLDPDAANERLNRVFVLIRIGEKVAAKADIEWIIEKAPTGFDLDRLRELHRNLKSN